MKFSKALIVCILLFLGFVMYFKSKNTSHSVFHFGIFKTPEQKNKTILSDNMNGDNNISAKELDYTVKEYSHNVNYSSKVYKECILFTSKTFNFASVDHLVKYVNNKPNSFFKLCENIYLVIPITKSIVHDSNYENIKLIRILYPKPELFSILLPLNTDFDKDEILIVEIKQFDMKKIEKSVDEFTKTLNMTLFDNNDIKLKEYSIHQLRYLWLYLGLEFVEKHLDELQSYTIERISKEFKKFEKKLKDRRCLSNYKNEDMTLIIRFFKRANTKPYLHQISLFDKSLKVISVIQNKMYINPYEEFQSIIKSNKKELNYFWCSNWNSVFFMSRLLPLLYYNKYTMWCDDDEVFNSNMTNTMKYISNKYNAMLGSHGLKSSKDLKIKYNGMNNEFKFGIQIYGSSFFQTRWQVNLWRFRSYYKLWGDDIITELISEFECNMNQLLSINNTKLLIGLKSFGVSTNMQNASMYGKGHKIMDGVIKRCTRDKSESSVALEMRNKCFYSAYI